MTDVIAKVSRALGRACVPTTVPAPPVIDESVVRLIATDLPDLPGRFIETARASHTGVRESSRETLATDLVAELTARVTKSVVVTRSGALASIDAVAKLSEAGIEAKWWSDLSRDACFNVEVGITDSLLAVAETGSVVVRASLEHGRSVSLVPPLHIAIVERSRIVADLIDAMEILARDGVGTGAVFITGPSKTADIEMTMVTGVHGPVELLVFLI